MGRSQSAILKIIRQARQNSPNVVYKPNTTAGDECQIHWILISNRFANCGEIFKAWIDSDVAISLLITFWIFYQFRYDNRLPISKSPPTFKRKIKLLISSKLVCWSMEPGHLQWGIKIMHSLRWSWSPLLEKVIQVDDAKCVKKA